MEGGEPEDRRPRATSGDEILHYRALSGDNKPRKSLGEEEYRRPPSTTASEPGGLDDAAKAKALVWSFCAMVGVGLGNKIFQKLETIPMYNYPNFLNLLTTAAYIPLSFAYVVPATKRGWIREDNFTVPKKDFAVMGFLDSLAAIMQIFAATYLPGSLLVLLLQSAIPVSMALSRGILKTTYHVTQYICATIVMAGILVVLAPSLSGGDDDDGSAGKRVLWSVVLIASCVPMCLSSIYKQISLGEVDLDPIYLNAWIAVFQFLFSIPLAIPAALAGDPSVSPADLPKNLWDGFRCYVGISTIKGPDEDDDAVHADSCNPQAPVFVNVYLIFNVCYNILIIFILKYGNANVLWLAMTVMVPLGNLAFALPFMPQNQSVTAFDMGGLVIIMMGLIGYRKGPDFFEKTCPLAGDKQLKDDGAAGQGSSEDRSGTYAELSLSEGVDSEVGNPITFEGTKSERTQNLLQPSN